MARLWFFLVLLNSSSFSATRLSISCFTCPSSSWARSTLFSSCSRVPSASSRAPCNSSFTCPLRLFPPPSSALCHEEMLVLPALLLPGLAVISLRETGLLTGRHPVVRTRLVLLALDRRPWSSAEDLAVANPPSSSSVTNRVFCHLSALSCSASEFTLVQTSHIAEKK